MEKFLSKSELRAVTNLSPVTVWRLEKAGQFPKRRQLSPGRVAWLQSEVLAWLEGRQVVNPGDGNQGVPRGN